MKKILKGIIERTSDKALCITVSGVDNHTQWIPRSQVTLASEVEDIKYYKVKEWWLEQEPDLEQYLITEETMNVEIASQEEPKKKE